MSISFSHRIHPRARRLKITLSDQGEVVVTTPPRVSRKIIENFVQNQADWINHHQQKLLRRLQQQPANTINIFGKRYDLEFKLADQLHLPGVHRQGTKLTIASLSENHDLAREALNRFIKSVSSSYFLQVVPKLASQMEVKIGRIAFKTQKTRWGSCSSKGNLNFNWRLVHAPKAVIDYVIIHELAHRVHMDHSANFWNLVAKYDPNYKQHRKWLKKHGFTLTNLARS